MKLIGHPKSKEYLQIIERLKGLSLAFNEEYSKDRSPLILEDGKNHNIGFEQIQTHLDQLEGELKQWYYCNC